MSTPSSVEALVQQVQEDQKPTLVKQQIPLPKPGDYQVLVKVSWVAQNPTDIQSLDGNAFGEGAVLGCDYVGTVTDIGSKVTRISKGTTVAGLIWGGEVKGLGGFSTYTLAHERICFPCPEGVSPAEAATVPLASTTALLSLFSEDCLAIKKKEGEKPTVLVWGGSSSVGLFAIQIARIRGLDVITTCSPKHFDLVKSYGAREAFNYRDEQVVDNIRAAAPGLQYVFDTIGSQTSSEQSAKAISHANGVYCTVRPDKSFTESIKNAKVTAVLVWTAFPKEHRYGKFHWPASEGDHKLSSGWFDELPKLLQSGALKPNSTKVYENGLDDVHKGFQEYRDGSISNFKIVYKI